MGRREEENRSEEKERERTEDRSDCWEVDGYREGKEEEIDCKEE